MTAILPWITGATKMIFPKRREKKPYQFVSPDGSTFLPAGEDLSPANSITDQKFDDVLRAFGLAPFPLGKPFMLSDEDAQMTYKATVDRKARLTNLNYSWILVGRALPKIAPETCLSPRVKFMFSILPVN